MVQYNDELKEEIRSANDIVDVISQYVTLKRSGRNFLGLCPFHKEKTPSFSVSADKQYYHCFGCHKGGDVFNFVSEIEKIPFKDALEILAEKAKIALPVSEDPEINKKQYVRDRMFKINSETTFFYHERLYKPLAKIAQDYVKQRKLDNATLKAFKIGYSGEFNELYKFLKSKGFKEEEILSSGLVYKSDKGDFIDKFRKRLMFPIVDVTGKVVAFGGRKLEQDDKTAKYINSNENLIYSKKKHLFALNLAKQSDSKKVILVEGYMDAISLHQRGVKNAVASLGTALTEEQGRLLRKYFEQVIFSYDSDSAGQTAVMRGLEVLESQGCDARIMELEDAKDPDEYIIKYGSGRFSSLVEKAISLVEFKIKMIKTKYNLNNTNDKIRFLKEITKVLSVVDNKIEKEIYIDKIAKQYNISIEAIYAEVNKAIQTKASEKTLLGPIKRNVTMKKENISDTVTKREDLIIYLLVNHFKEVGNKIKDNINIDDFKLEENKTIFEKIIECSYEEPDKILQSISNIEDVDIQSHISEILMSDYEINSVEKCIEDIVIIYNNDKLSNKKLEIIQKLKDKDLTKEEIAKFENELNDIIIELAKRK